MSIPIHCPKCGSPRAEFRRNSSTGRIACGRCGEDVEGKDAAGGRPSNSSGEARPETKQAGDRLSGPATGLWIVGLLSSLASLATIAAGIQAAVQGPTLPGDVVTPARVVWWYISYYAAVASVPGSALALTAAILFGARQMSTRGSWAWAVVGTLAAMAPCCNFTALIGFPIGIWALIVLFDPPVKAVFR